MSLTGNAISGNPRSGYEGKPLALHVLACGDRGPRTDFLIRGNTATQAVGGSFMPTIAMNRVDGVTVTDNRQPVTSGQWAQFPGSTGVTFANNDTTP